MKDTAAYFVELSQAGEALSKKIKENPQSSEDMIESANKFAQNCSKLGSFFSDRLWHQLTVTLIDISTSSEFLMLAPDAHMKLYEQALSEFENK